MPAQPHVLVVGTGSVGTRHARNLVALGARVDALSYRGGDRDDLKALGVTCHTSLEEALAAEPDAVVCANRTDLHLPVALAAARRGAHLFIEKPVTHDLAGIDELRRVVLERRLVVEVGCMRRFHPALREMRRLVSDGSIGNALYAHVAAGQYLPDWRPGSDYRDSYSVRASHGGGVLLDLIHEIDTLIWWFGRVASVRALAPRVSALEVDAEDLADVLLEFASGPVAHLHVDYVRPTYRRAAEVVGTIGVVRWDSDVDVVSLERRGQTPVRFTMPERFERNSMFRDHMAHFLARIEDGGPPAVSLSDGVHALEVALAARRAHHEERNIRIDPMEEKK